MRRSIEIMADLLEKTIDGQWSAEQNTACHCHPEYAAVCPECKAFRDSHLFGRLAGQGGQGHAKDCPRIVLIEEAREFLKRENEAAEARGEDAVYIP
jgi:hypothetical protein